MEMKKIKELKPNKKNPRFVKDPEYKRLKKSIEEFGFLKQYPIVVSEDMTILSGNQRYRVCKELGIEEVPIIILNEKDISDYKAKYKEKTGIEITTDQIIQKMVLTGNQHAGEWDFDMLKKDDFWDAKLIDDWTGIKISFDDDIEQDAEYDDPTATFTATPEEYANSNIRQVNLYFSVEEYEQFIGLGTLAMAGLDCKDNTTLFMKLLKNYEENIGKK